MSNISDGTGQLSEFTLHVVLATFPQRQEREFDTSVRENFYESYREKCQDFLTTKDPDYGYQAGDSETPFIYNPLTYHIMGNYDIAYIALVDSFKFAQRLFEPQLGKTQTVKLFAPHTFQSFTGITHHSADFLKDFFHSHLRKDEPKRKFFLGICNLKLNNGFLIGNGRGFLNVALKKIDEVISKVEKRRGRGPVEHLKVQSFSWFEISLLIFADNPQTIAEIIQELRRLTIFDLLSLQPSLIENSLYNTIFSGNKEEFFHKANVFADTHTYVGIHADIFKKGNGYYEELERAKIKLDTEVEWQIKPGHMHLLTKILSDKDVLGSLAFREKDKYFLAGRSDYCLKNKRLTYVIDNVKLIRLVIDKESQLFDHVRKMKTKVYFKSLPKKKRTAAESDAPAPKSVIMFHEKLMDLAEDMSSVEQINKQLKALKISRQIRSKVLKIFSNYNNGIQDIILFPYLLDFCIFIKRLKDAIDEAYINFEKRFSDPVGHKENERKDKLEDILMKMIDIFQEGFNIRMLNPYQFEDINDFDLDFNSSIQQLLSVYSSTAFEMGNLIYKKPYTYGPVIQLNLKDTISHDSSINYYINHLTSPEFVFATITKEIINSLPNDDDESLGKMIKDYTSEKHALLEKDPVIKDMDERSLINISYFLNDSFRFVWSYHMDFKLFYYWFWAYNFQNASLYAEMGLMDENHFEKELFRVMFIRKFFNKDADIVEDVNCPIPELRTYWDRHFQKTSDAVTRFLAFLDKIEISHRFMKYLVVRFDLLMEKSEKSDIEPLILNDLSAATTMQNKIERRYRSIMPHLSKEFTYRLARRCFVFDQIKTEDVYVPVDSILYLESYMWKYLNDIYNENRGTISLLRRNWQDGEPLRGFIQQNVDPHLYSIDQTGGLYFESMRKQNLYFRKSSTVMLDIWNYSLLRKEKFIKHMIPPAK